MAKAKKVQSEQQAVVVTSKRLPLGDAIAHNKQFAPVAPDSATAAAIAFTAKGTNPKRVRVYGYDNLSDGGAVPKDKRVALVAGVTGTPKGVGQQAWEALVAAVTANPDATVAQHKEGGIAGRTLRRAYRAGAIRFAV